MSNAMRHGRHAAGRARMSTRGTAAHVAGCELTRARRGRRLAVALLAGGSLALVGSGAFAAWQTSRDVNSGSVTAATAGLTLLDANGSTFTTGVPNLLPGDYFYRYVDIRNDGTLDSAFTGTVSAGGDLLGNLSATVDRCTVAWTTVSGVSTCTGSLTSVNAETTVPGAGSSVALGTISPGTVNAAHVRYRFKLADAAPSTLMGGISTVGISASATATGGRDRTAS